MSEGSLELPGEGERLGELLAFLHAFWRSQGLPEGEAFPFELSLEELFMNVAMHGTADASSPPQVRIDLHRCGDQVELLFQDRGIPFDPLSLPTPDLTEGVETRQVGGLGVFLVREMMDEVEYSFKDGWNCMRLAKRLATG